MFRNLTVTCINGGADGAGAVAAIQTTMAQLPGSSGLLISTSRPANLPSSIGHARVYPFSYLQYSMFVIHCLHCFIETEFVLIVQEDGWALNGANWRPEWWTYDYVGAPCHAARVGDSFLDRYSWEGNPDAIQVMNGGFSLRSRRFLQAANNYGILYDFNQNQKKMLCEDLQLCLIMRPELEHHGLRFAPLECASTFAIEAFGPQTHAGIDTRTLFGHHTNYLKLRDGAVVDCKVPEPVVNSLFRENEKLELLRHYGYRIRFPGDTSWQMI